MLTTLQPSYGHLFEEPDKLLAGLAARAAIAWQDITHSEVSKAYKRASLRLHPDRMRRRDVAVRLEAEEVLKQLTQAYSDAPAWYKGFAEKRTRAGAAGSSKRAQSDLARPLHDDADDDNSMEPAPHRPSSVVGADATERRTARAAEAKPPPVRPPTASDMHEGGRQPPRRQGRAARKHAGGDDIEPPPFVHSVEARRRAKVVKDAILSDDEEDGCSGTGSGAKSSAARGDDGSVVGGDGGGGGGGGRGRGGSGGGGGGGGNREGNGLGCGGRSSRSAVGDGDDAKVARRRVAGTEPRVEDAGVDADIENEGDAFDDYASSVVGVPPAVRPEYRGDEFDDVVNALRAKQHAQARRKSKQKAMAASPAVASDESDSDDPAVHANNGKAGKKPLGKTKAAASTTSEKSTGSRELLDSGDARERTLPSLSELAANLPTAARPVRQPSPNRFDADAPGDRDTLLNGSEGSTHCCSALRRECGQVARLFCCPCMKIHGLSRMSANWAKTQADEAVDEDEALSPIGEPTARSRCCYLPFALKRGLRLLQLTWTREKSRKYGTAGRRAVSSSTYRGRNCRKPGTSWSRRAKMVPVTKG